MKRLINYLCDGGLFGLTIGLLLLNMHFRSTTIYYICVFLACAGLVMWKIQELHNSLNAFKKAEEEHKRMQGNFEQKVLEIIRRPSSPHNNMVSYHVGDGTRTGSSSSVRHTIVKKNQPPASNEQ